MKALFYGGAFNPPTNAHLALAEFALKRTDFDKVLFVPSKSQYILSQEGKTFSFLEEERLLMLRLLAANRPFMEVSDIELSYKTQPRTYMTMKRLKQEGYDEIKLLFGSDWLRDGFISKWMYLKEIALEFGFVVFPRNKDNVYELIENNPILKELKDYFVILDSPKEYRDVSSSKVRALLPRFQANEETIKKMVPHEIFDYLKERNNG